MTWHKTPIYKIRTIWEVLEAAVKYPVKNAGSLYSSLGLYAFPLIIVSLLLSIYLTRSSQSLLNVLDYRYSLDKNRFLLLIVAFIMHTLGTILHNQIISRHLLQNNSTDAEQQANTKSIKQYLRSDFFSLLINYLLFTFLIYLLTLLYNYVATSSTADTDYTYGYGESMLNSMVTKGVLYIPLIVVAPFVFYFYIASLFVSLKERLDFTDSIKKVWFYTKDHLKEAWLANLAFLALTYGIIYSVSAMLSILLFWLPDFLGTNTFVTFYTPYMIINHLFKFFVIVLYQVAAILYFGKLVEMKEAYSLKEKIELT